MNFLGSFWIVSLAGSLLSTQNPLQTTNQGASQLPEAAASGDSSSSTNSSSASAEAPDLNLFPASHSSYAPGLSLLSCGRESCPEDALLIGEGLLPAEGFVDFPGSQSLARGELTSIQSWMQPIDRRFNTGNLNPLAPLSSAPWFKSNSLGRVSPLVSEAVHFLDLRESPITFRSFLSPLSDWTGNIEFDIWSYISDVKVIPAIQTKLEDVAIKGKGPDQAGPFSLKACLTCMSKQAGGSKTPDQRFQVWVKDYLVAEVVNQQAADLLADRFRDLLHKPDVDWSALQPVIVDGAPAAKAGNDVLFTIKDASTVVSKTSPESDYDTQKIAVEWVNNLRLALGKSPLKIFSAEGQQPILKKTEKRFKGIASWYGPYFHGRLTATGEIFNQDELTAAHPSLPFDTYLKVKNLLNNRTVIVRVNDRGPYLGERSLDLSREAARRLDSETVGVIPYEATILEPFSLEGIE